MLKQQFEAKVFDAIDSVLNHRRIEDSFIELKANIIREPKAQKFARQLAGRANSARQNPIIFIFGLDEKKHSITELDIFEPSNWWATVQAAFEDGLAPDMIYNLFVPYEGERLWAVLFDTSRSPYVVKTKGEQTQFEVPWSDGTITRSAKRRELLRMLNAKKSVPRFLLNWARLDASEHSPAYCEISFYALIENRSTISFVDQLGSVTIDERCAFNISINERYVDTIDHSDVLLLGCHVEYIPSSKQVDICMRFEFPELPGEKVDLTFPLFKRPGNYCWTSLSYEDPPPAIEVV